MDCGDIKRNEVYQNSTTLIPMCDYIILVFEYELLFPIYMYIILGV